MKTCDVVVAGAGIVGAACARRLASSGLRTWIVDPHFAGSGATAAGMGHLVVMDDSDEQFALTRYSQQLWNELEERLPKSIEFQKNGTLWIATDDEELNIVAKKREYYVARGMAAESIDARALYDYEPNLRRGFVGALRVTEDSILYPPAAARWLLDDAAVSGAHVRIGESIVEANESQVRLSSGELIACGAWVNATGIGASQLCPGLPIRPRKGHLLITDRHPNFVRHQLVELGYLKSAHGHATESVAFNVQPRMTGQLIIGSSRQFDVTTRIVEPQILNRMLRRAIDFLPDLVNLSAIRSWTGFRAATPDSLPLIGPWPKMPGCYLASGHEGLGITTALGTAELIAAQILSHTTPIPMKPYLPERFLAEN